VPAPVIWFVLSVLTMAAATTIIIGFFSKPAVFITRKSLGSKCPYLIQMEQTMNLF
jgi:hypothetical protein